MAEELPGVFGTAAPSEGIAVADTLYAEARAELSAGNLELAAELFARVHRERADTPEAGDALYWEAFARYQRGEAASDTELQAALVALERQAVRYEAAATRADADALATRIRGRLAERGDAEAGERLSEEARAVPDECVPERQDERAEALAALVRLDREQALPVLRRVLERTDDCSVPVRTRAVFEITRYDDEIAEPVLHELARGDPSAEVRSRAVYRLSRSGTARSLDFLEELARTSDDSDIAENAVFALSRIDDERSGDILRGLIEDPTLDDDLRSRVVWRLARRDGDEAIAYLRGLYERVESATVREQTFSALGRIGGEANARWLLSRALDVEEPVELRKRALFQAGRVGIPVGELTALYDRLDDPEMKVQLMYVLSRRDEAAATDRLAEIARTETDTELQQRAIHYLSRSNDRRAAEVLLEIIDP